MLFAVLLLLPEVSLGDEELVRFGMICAIFAMFLAAMVCVGVLVSSLTHQSATAFVILLFVWIGSVVVLPRLGFMAANAIRPAPSNQQLQANLRSVGIAHNKVRFSRQEKWENEWREQTGKEWWQTPEGTEARARTRYQYMTETRAKSDPEVRGLRVEFRNRYLARLDLAIAFARLSPAFALRNAAVLLSGTGVDRNERFLGSVRKGREAHRVWYWEEVLREGIVRANPEKHGQFKLEAIPLMNYTDTWPQTDFARALTDLASLILWSIVFFAGAYVALIRYDPR